jgi:uncharacterized protein YgbK (DUF1537 family)
VLILADDLTGAADAAAPFALLGLRASVVLAPRAAHGRADDPAPVATDSGEVVSVDVDSRAMTPTDAVAATRAAYARHAGHAADGVLVKIDSTMRGHVRATVDAVLSCLPAPPSRVVVCPAFPALGRTVVDGTVCVDGEPVPHGVIREHFAGFAAGPRLFIAAAESDEHLAALVASTDADVLWVGSAGIARHLAARRALDRARDPNLVAQPVARQPSATVVVVVGSRHRRTIEQLARVPKGVRVLRIDPRDEAFLEQARPAIAAADGLVLTGGHTARAILDLLGVDRFQLGGEVETGVAWGVADVAGHAVTLVTKSGGFGDTETLRRAVHFLGATY